MLPIIVFDSAQQRADTLIIVSDEGKNVKVVSRDLHRNAFLSQRLRKLTVM